MARLPVVRDGALYPATDATPIQLDDAAWCAWLRDARSFTFSSADGRLTARREERSGSFFWYGYRRQNGVLHKTYLGRSQDLTQARLEQASRDLARDEDVTFPAKPAPWAPTLIATKTTVPQLGTSHIMRCALSDRCIQEIEKPCVLVTAPAGFGKTTLLSETCARLKDQGWRVAWLSLEATERDPVRFWMYLLAALEGAHPGISKAVRPMMQLPRSLSVEGMLANLINHLAPATEPMVLMLDDYHLASMDAIDQGLTFLIDHAPATLHLIIASRTEPGFPLPRLRAQGRITELRAIDLRFSAEEARRFLSETMHVNLSAVHLAMLTKRTEGWVAGLQLAALSLREQTDMPELPLTTPHYVAEYLVGEVLDHQPPDIRAFLLQTAILDRMSGPLCDAVTQKMDGAAMLARLMQAQLFVTPLDANLAWFRYHHLFAEVLRGRCERENPALFLECHRRAAHWLKHEGMIGEAINHLITAHAFDEAAMLIQDEGERLILRGETSGLIAWVRALPREITFQFPHLCIIFATGLLFQSEGTHAVAWLDDLERHLHATNGFTLPLQGEIEVMRAFLCLMEGRLRDAAELAAIAVEHIAPDDRLMRALGLWLVNITGVIGYDDITEVGRRIAEVGEESLRMGNIFVAFMALITVAGIEVYQGRLHRAVLTCQETLRIVPPINGEEAPMLAMTYCLLGDIKREWNDLDGAETDIRHALEIGVYPSNAEFLNDGLISLALIIAERGQGEESLAAFEDHRHLIRMQQLAQLDIPQMEVVRLRVLLMHGHLSEAMRWAEECRTERERRDPSTEMPLMRWEEDLALSRVALACGHGAAEIATLHDLCAKAERAGRLRDALNARILLARAQDMAGHDDAAMRALETALNLAAPEGFMRVFLDEGQHIATLLARYCATHPSSPARAYALKLLAADGDAVEPPPMLSPTTLLSARELDVLRQLALGHSSKAIADELVLTLSTVKWHIARIYRKLGVTGRVQAVASARERHIIA